MINERDMSVIIPMYNSEKTIGRVIEAILNQSKSEYIKEIIVVNDGSIDNSKSIVELYMSNNDIPIILINKENKGVSHTRNVGMEKSSGQWIAFCDSDDLWEKNKLERQVAVINENDSIDLLGANHIDKPLNILTKRIDSLYQASIKDLCIKIFPQTSTIVMKKKIFDEIGGFDERQLYAEDGNYLMKIVNKYNYYYLPERLVNYGDGKSGFGESGLSANMVEMQKGTVKNLKEMHEKGYISNLFYIVMRVFYWLKYIRRIFIVKFRR